MTFRRLLNWLVGVPLAIIVVVFAVANRHWITVSLDPLSADAPRAYVNMPQWALLFIGVLIGLLVGWVAAWWGQGKHRRAAREARVELYRVQADAQKATRESEARARAVMLAEDATP